MRLSEKTLDQLPANIQKPAYGRKKVVPSIVHLGIGAFHRAHQAMFTDKVLSLGDLSWGILGAGVISADMKNALIPQNGLYALSERSASGESTRIIGSIVDVLGGEEDAKKLLAKMSDISTRIVSITVTEKGYYLDLATGKLQTAAPKIAADLQNPEAPKTILGLIVAALKNRKAKGIPPFTVLSCDNLPNNGHLAKAAVIAFAKAVNADLAAWVEKEVRFPCTMVDRITPATTEEDKTRVNALLGQEDAWPVVTESFVQWVIEDEFTMGRPDWDKAGAIFSNEIERWENMKLRCLNGAHSTLSYLGQLLGRETVADAMQDSFITSVLEVLWQEIQEVLHTPQGIRSQDYVESLKERFRNPSLKHKTAQIAMDGSQKLPQRLLAPLRDRINKGLSSPAIATAIAAWMHYVIKTADAGEALNDPLKETILAAAKKDKTPEVCVQNLLAIDPIFGEDLPKNAAFCALLLEKFAAIADKVRVA